MSDSDGVPEAGDASKVWIAATAPPLYGARDETFDLGFTTTISLGNLVWADTDGNGVKGAGESGIGNVRVELYSCSGALGSTPAIVPANFITFTITGDGGSLGALGEYRFTAGLLPNTQYCVVLDTNRAPLRDQYQPTVRGADPVADNDSNGFYLGNVGTNTGLITSGVVATGNLGQDVNHVDFGLVEQFVLGNYVWRDTGGPGGTGLPDGVQQPTEAVVSGVNVQLFGATAAQVKTGAVLATTATGNDGIYLFNSLYHGMQRNTRYVVSLPYRPAPLNFQLQSLQPTRRDAPNDDALDSDGELVGTLPMQQIDAYVQTENWGVDILTIDFGFTQELSIGDFVWNDVNLNGIQDSGESGIGQVPVDLYSCPQGVCTWAARALTNPGVSGVQLLLLLNQE
jgi:hypothetical protein